MAIIRNQKKEQNFTSLNNILLQNTKLSLRAKGLLCYLLSLPPNWELRIESLLNQIKERKHILYGVLKELKDHGYIVYHRQRHKDGRVDHGEYWVYEEAQITNPLPSENQEEEEGLLSDFQDEANLDEVDQPVINNNYNKKITTAENTSKLQKQSAAANFIKIEQLISNTLTKSQKDALVQTVKTELLPVDEPKQQEALCLEIEFCLLDKTSYTHAAQDFHHKLNIIKKVFRQGQWRTPSSLFKAREEKIQQKNQAFQSERQTKIHKIRYHREEIRWCEEMMALQPRDDKMVHYCNEKIKEHTEAIRAVSAEIKLLEQEPLDIPHYQQNPTGELFNHPT